MSFTSNPKEFCQSNACLINGGGQFESLGKAVGVKEVFEYDTVLVNVATAKQGGITNLTVSPTQNKAIQFLPYRASELTYTKISGEASVFITGPLSGCNVYVAKKGADIYVFHVNANKHDTSIEKNVKYKRELFYRAAGHLGINTAGAGEVERHQYSGKSGHPVDGALVVGYKDSGGKWHFYFSGWQVNGTVTLFFRLHVMNEA